MNPPESPARYRSPMKPRPASMYISSPIENTNNSEILKQQVNIPSEKPQPRRNTLMNNIPRSSPQTNHANLRTSKPRPQSFHVSSSTLSTQSVASPTALSATASPTASPTASNRRVNGTGSGNDQLKLKPINRLMGPIGQLDETPSSSKESDIKAGRRLSFIPILPSRSKTNLDTTPTRMPTSSERKRMNFTDLLDASPSRMTSLPSSAFSSPSLKQEHDFPFTEPAKQQQQHQKHQNQKHNNNETTSSTSPNTSHSKVNSPFESMDNYLSVLATKESRLLELKTQCYFLQKELNWCENDIKMFKEEGSKFFMDPIFKSSPKSRQPVAHNNNNDEESFDLGKRVSELGAQFMSFVSKLAEDDEEENNFNR